jgi:hypothetical protein
MPLLAISDHQLDFLQSAAARVSPRDRGAFLRSIAGRLAHVADLTDANVVSAIDLVLTTRGMISGSIRSLASGYPRQGDRQRRKLHDRLNFGRFTNKEIAK